VTHQTAEEAFDSAACIGCGACVATVKTEVLLYLLLKITHMALLPQGKEERSKRVLDMVSKWIPNYSGTVPIRKPVKWNVHREFLYSISPE
jgi:Fe-S-cluster-containing dehydrogenase component